MNKDCPVSSTDGCKHKQAFQQTGLLVDLIGILNGAACKEFSDVHDPQIKTVPRWTSIRTRKRLEVVEEVDRNLAQYIFEKKEFNRLRRRVVTIVPSSVLCYLVNTVTDAPYSLFIWDTD